jgi:hypothetical protein
MQPIYNDASLVQIDTLMEEYNSSECTDERRAEIESLLLGLSEQKEVRIDELYKSYCNAEQESAGVAPLIKRLSDRRAMANKKMATAERLIAFLQGEGNKGETISGGKLTWRKSTVTLISGDVPQEYRKPGEPMLTEIKKAIQQGIEVPGAYLEERNNLQIK